MNSLNISQRLLQYPQSFQRCIALLAGAIVPFSFAPFHIWPLGLIGLSLFAMLVCQQNVKNVLKQSWFFGVGLYGVGIHWIYFSISGFGGAPAPLAVILVALFVFFMASIFCLPFYILGRWFNHTSLSLWIAFPIIWLLNEWLRTWLLTGFPWLFIGYADLHNWLSGWAPITGVLGLSFFSACTAGIVADLCSSSFSKRRIIIGSFIITTFWGIGFALQKVEWTQIATSPTSIAIVQPNVDQEEKWQANFRGTMLDLLREKTTPLWGHKIIIWPEAAVTELYSEALPFLNEMNRTAADNHSGLLTGIIYDDAVHDAYYNSIVTFGDAIGIHHKQRLVPFGEYVPLEFLRNIIEFFNLPTSIISLGPDDQHLLKVDDLFISPSICYEVAFPDLVAKSAVDSQLLVSISNLGWFGDSLGRHQFMEMAQMRALETQHYFAYSTNNGPSAIFDNHGNTLIQTNAFEQSTLSSKIFAANGNTPFMLWGSIPLVILSFVGLTLLKLFDRKIKRNMH